MLSAIAGLMMMTGCATHKTGKVITVTPAPYTLTPDSANRAQLDVQFHVPGHYFSKRSRIVITPQVMTGDTVVDEFMPIAVYSPIYSKKAERQRVLEGKQDIYEGRIVKAERTSRPMDVPYSEAVQLSDDISHARIKAVISTDGCGECTGIDTIDVATITTPVMPANVKKELELSWIEPEFRIRPKVMEGRGVANLQFVINKHDINLAMGNNRRELEEMVAKLSPVLSDTLATLTSLEIFGMASADGPLSFNTPLSRNRANSAKNWLVNRLGISPKLQKTIKVGSRPEGWQPVLDAMTADGHPDASKVKDILVRYAGQNDDVAERYIRRLDCWKDIRAKYLQKDRKVEYVYTYKIRSFTTDAELLSMYEKRPDAFNEDELLRVATLAKDHNQRKEVYLTLMKYFPQSTIGANNLAVLYLREGNTEEAQRVIDSLKEHTEDEKLNGQPTI